MLFIYQNDINRCIFVIVHESKALISTTVKSPQEWPPFGVIMVGSRIIRSIFMILNHYVIVTMSEKNELNSKCRRIASFI